MAAHGLAERKATVARLKEIPGVIQPDESPLVWQGSVEDDKMIPRDGAGKVFPYIVIDFGAPVRSTRDRNLTNAEQGQPHVLPASVACIAGTAEDAQELMASVFEMLVDWKPSATADPWESQGGYGTRQPSTGSTPTRFIEGLFLQTVVNHGVDGD